MRGVRGVGERVVISTDGDRHVWLDPGVIKKEQETLSAEARAAMSNVTPHIEKMVCYTCHSNWAPQCYGCHVKIDFSAGKKSFDWVAAGHEHMTETRRSAPSEQGFGTMLPGEVTETRSYMRWEDPPLGMNGEGRVSPLIPGCQMSATIIGEDGKEIVRNHIFRTSPHSEGAGEEGQLGIDMSPVQPHTTGKARRCESCHASDKALGYGIGGGRMQVSVAEGTTVDLTTADGQVLPRNARLQIEAVPGLMDWSRVVTQDGEQTQTVGHHFEGSGPLSQDQRMRMDRGNVCVSCHAEIPDQDLAVSLLHHVAETTGQIPASNREHSSLVHKILLTAAWAQVGGGMLLGLGVAFALGLVWRRRKRTHTAA